LRGDGLHQIAAGTSQTTQEPLHDAIETGKYQDTCLAGERHAFEALKQPIPIHSRPIDIQDKDIWRLAFSVRKRAKSLYSTGKGFNGTSFLNEKALQDVSR
jgi:hypothetical protein